MKYIKTYEYSEHPYTIKKMCNILSKQIFKLSNILPYNENDYYKISSTPNSISITRIINKTKKETIGYIVISKKDDYTKKSKFGVNVNEKNFTILFRCKPDKDPYIHIISHYIMDIIKQNIGDYKIETSNHFFKEDLILIFNENKYDEVINNISNLSIENLDLEIMISANNFNL